MNSESLGQNTKLNPLNAPQLVIRGNGNVEILTLVGRTIWTFGRSKKSTVQLDDLNASRIHAQLAIYPNNSCYFVDLKSRNGTLINGEPATVPTVLKHGDQIVIGNTVFIFKHALEQTLSNALFDTEVKVLMLYESSAQAVFWQEILAFQGIKSVRELSVLELKKRIDSISDSVNAAKVLIMDVRAYQGDCYQFCRWIRQNHPQHQIFLVDSKRRAVSMLERQVAIKNGAVNQFPAMSRRDLVLNSTEVLRQVNEVLQILDTKLIAKEELLSIVRTNKILKDWHSAESQEMQLI